MSKRFGEWVRSQRIAAGLTQIQLAALVGIQSGSAVTVWERGSSEPRDEQLIQLSRVFGVPVLDIVGHTDTYRDAPALVRARWRRGLTKEEVARKMRVRRESLVSWEAGTNEPGLRNIEKLGLLYDTVIEYRPRPIKSPVSYYGSKGRYLSVLVPLVEGPRYIEPFGGSATVLLARRPSELEVYNDIDDRMCTLFRVLRDPDGARELRRRLTATPYARASYAEAEDLVDTGTELERAWAQFVLLGQSFNARPLPNNWNSVATSRRINGWWKRVAWIEGWHERLALVQFENTSALDVIHRHDSADSVFYLDPPYEKTTRRTHYKQYRHDLGNHDELIECVVALQGRVVLSGFDATAYDPLKEAGWDKIHVKGREFIWVNRRAARRRRAA